MSLRSSTVVNLPLQHRVYKKASCVVAGDLITPEKRAVEGVMKW